MPFPSQPYTPVKVDPMHDGSAAAGFNQFRSTPFKNGANWFFVLYDDSNSLFEVLKSTDDQLTWAVVATITSVTTTVFRTFSDGTKLYTAYVDTGGTGHVTFFDYNMSTATLTGPYGATGGPGVSPLVFYVRPSDGKYVVITSSGSPVHHNWYVFNPTGATWAGPNNLGANATNVVSFQSNDVWGVEDPNLSVGHCFFEYNNTDGHRHLCYQQIASNDTLGTFHDFGTGTLNGNPVSGNAISAVTDPLLDTTNNNIILPIYDTVSTGQFILILGAGFGTPTWSASLIDTFQWFLDCPQLQLIASTFTAVAIDGGSFNQDRVYYYSAAQSSSPGTGWSAKTTLFRGDQVSISWTTGGLRHVTIGTQAAGLFLYFGSTDPTGAFHVEYALGSSASTVYHYRVLTSASLSPSNNNALDWTFGGVQL